MIKLICIACFILWLSRGRPLGCVLRVAYDMGKAMISILAVYLLICVLTT